jgi:hypothetical protein
MLIGEIQEIWAQIRGLSAATEVISARPLAVDGLSEFDVLLCITQDGSPGILLRNTGAKAHLPKTGCGRLIVKREQLMRENSQPDDYIRIECLESSLEAPFALLVSQVVSHLASGATPSKACMDAVLEFRRLLSRNGGLLPSEDEILGLVGELLLLRRLVSASPHLWQGWNGPLGSARDYSWGPVDIEAKASRMAGESRLTVNGLDQLEPDEDRELLIHHSVLTGNPVGTIDVPGLVDEIRGQISDPEGFDTRLASAGYLSEQSELWSEHRFTLHGSCIYRVSDDFPRIRKSDLPGGSLPAGVAKLRYDILLSNCSNFRLSNSEEEALYIALAQSAEMP